MPPPQSNKRQKPITPEKGIDKCAVAGCLLDNSSCAIQCDKCDQWLCAQCLSMSSSEYDIFVKMNDRLGSTWVCPMCKSRGSAQQDLPQLLKSALNEHCSEMKAMYVGFQNEIRTSLEGINARVQSLENIISSKVSMANVEEMVNHTIDIKLKTEVQKMVLQENDRLKRRMNLVAYGVPPQTNDLQFLQNFLKNMFQIDVGAVTNLQRLTRTNPNSNAPNSSNRPDPLLFSVSSFKTKIDILTQSHIKKGDIRFYADTSKEDRVHRKELVEEIKKRAAAGEQNLGIKNGCIVTKKVLKRVAITPNNRMAL